MTALAGTRFSVGNILEGLLSASFTLTMGNLALQGLSKVAIVARRGVDECLKGCGFDTSKSNSFANKAASFVPERFSNFFSYSSDYNAITTETRNNHVQDAAGNVKTDVRNVPVYKHSSVTLLVSGLGLSLFALVALEAKEALWRPAHPLLNGVLQYISPFRAHLGQSWVADGINHMVGAVKARI